MQDCGWAVGLFSVCVAVCWSLSLCRRISMCADKAQYPKQTRQKQSFFSPTLGCSLAEALLLNDDVIFSCVCVCVCVCACFVFSQAPQLKTTLKIAAQPQT